MPHRLLPFALILLTFAAPPARAQTPPAPVVTSVTEVTVYRRGATVTRAGAARVPAGTTTLSFTGLTPRLDPSSVQFEARGALTVLSVVHRRDFLAGAAPGEAVAALHTVRRALRDSLEAVEAMIEVYAQEEALLLANRDLGGTDGVAVEELRAAAAFFRERLAAIKRAVLALRDEADVLRERLADVDRQLAELEAGDAGRATSTVEVTVAAEAPAQAAFTLAYVTPAAGWSPRYDVRVDDVGTPVRLGYRADVQQATGEDWRDVRLTLSTGDPARPGTLPELRPWRIGFAPERPAAARADGRGQAVVLEESLELNAGYDIDEPLADLPAPPPPVEQVAGLTTTRFVITVPYTIPSDGRPYTVAVDDHAVPATYAYYAAPRLDPSAFLTARLTDWADLGLVPGPANLFLEGAFVGTSYLDPAAVGDTLVMSLGRDDGVVVERELVRDVSGRRLLGTRQTETYAYAITVRNGRARAIPVVVEDVVPVSTDDALDVDADVDDGGVLDEATGLVRWRLVLPPNAAETVRFSYTLRYPAGRTVRF